MRRYTIEQCGDRWVASDGTHTVEDETAEDAFFGLLKGELNEKCGIDFDEGPASDRRGRASDRVGVGCLNLVRLLALGAPEQVVRATVEVIVRATEDWIVA